VLSCGSQYGGRFVERADMMKNNEDREEIQDEKKQNRLKIFHLICVPDYCNYIYNGGHHSTIIE